jgi:hypothetical protein
MVPLPELPVENIVGSDEALASRRDERAIKRTIAIAVMGLDFAEHAALAQVRWVTIGRLR